MSQGLSEDSRKTRPQRLMRLGALVFVQVIAAFALMEVVGQIYFDNPFPWAERFLYTSPDSFRDVGKFWTYSPNRDITETAIYKTGPGTFEKEYECHYPTDHLGFVDNVAHDSSDYDYLLLGDSFTQGQGGCPWAHRLRQELAGKSIYNAGLQGTGPGTWAPISRYLLQQGMRFGTVVVVFISDDFSRHLANYGSEQLECLHDLSMCHGAFFYPIAAGLDLKKSAAARAPQTSSFGQRAQSFCEEYLWVTCLIAEGAKHAFQPPQLPPMVSADGRDGFDWLMANFSSQLRFVRIRTKDELALKSDDAATIAVRRYLDERKIHWEDCDIGRDGFLRHDPHPNGNGYRRLADCIARILKKPALPA